jgi:hypothetical protein
MIPPVLKALRTLDHDLPSGVDANSATHSNISKNGSAAAGSGCTQCGETWEERIEQGCVA